MRKVVFRDTEGIRQSCQCGCIYFRRVVGRIHRYQCAECGKWYKVVKKMERGNRGKGSYGENRN